MPIGIKITLQVDGSLLFQADNETRSGLAESLRESWQRAESDFLEMVRGGEHNLDHLSPGDIYALTDMPLLADNCRDDDGAVRVYGRVWGFPDYQIRCHLQELAHKGRTIFVVVADYGEAGLTFPDHDSKAGEYLAVRAFENCLAPEYITEEIPDAHGEEGATIRRLVDVARRSPPPVIRDLFARA